jgi:pyridoxamine 5'-phosphate oxidase
MTLATATLDGAPAARIVLLKDVDANGFVFFTNYESDKASELDANPRACLVFFWAELERQVRVTGAVSRVDAGQSDAYFASRPLDSRLGAWASPQSRVIAGRDVLEREMARAASRFAGGVVPRPPHWGGYALAPATIEFWQGRPNRLHDRLRYQRAGDVWRIERLAP